MIDDISFSQSDEESAKLKIDRDDDPPIDVVQMQTDSHKPDFVGDTQSAQCSILDKMEELLEGDTAEEVNDYLNPTSQERRTSEQSNDEEDVDEDIERIGKQFKVAMKSGASGLSRSFKKILSNEQPPMKASSLVQKHSCENSITMIDASDRSGGGFRMSPQGCLTPGALAITAGVVHGVAGPGGVLCVIPAMKLANVKSGTIYMGVFCLASTLTMGGFAACYGSFSTWLACGCSNNEESSPGRVFLVEVASACLSISVGIVWLILLSIGELQVLYP